MKTRWDNKYVYIQSNIVQNIVKMFSCWSVWEIQWLIHCMPGATTTMHWIATQWRLWMWYHFLSALNVVLWWYGLMIRSRCLLILSEKKETTWWPFYLLQYIWSYQEKQQYIDSSIKSSSPMKQKSRLIQSPCLMCLNVKSFSNHFSNYMFSVGVPGSRVIQNTWNLLWTATRICEMFVPQTSNASELLTFFTFIICSDM